MLGAFRYGFNQKAPPATCDSKCPPLMLYLLIVIAHDITSVPAPVRVKGVSTEPGSAGFPRASKRFLPAVFHRTRQCAKSKPKTRSDRTNASPRQAGTGTAKREEGGGGLVNLPRNRYPRKPQHVRYFRLFQARRIVLKRQMLPLIAHAKLPQPVSIRKPAEMMELFIAQRRLQFVSDFDQCHSARNS
jgi:hypothetical protein